GGAGGSSGSTDAAVPGGAGGSGGSSGPAESVDAAVPGGAGGAGGAPGPAEAGDTPAPRGAGGARRASGAGRACGGGAAPWGGGTPWSGRIRRYGWVGWVGRRQRHPGHAGTGRRAGWHAGGRSAAGRRVPGAGPAPVRRRGAGRAGWCAVIRVLLADDQALVRAGFRALLDAQADIEVVGEAANGEQAVALARSLHPDVVLMDIRMPVLDGLAATARIAAEQRLSGVRVIILTTFELDEYVFEALRSGASGFLVKDTEPVDLIRGVRVVAAGDGLLSPGVTRRVIAEVATKSARPPPTTRLTALPY